MTTFINLKKRVASQIGYVDSSGDILTGKDIDATDIGNWINDRYLDDLVGTLKTHYPEDYEQEAKMNFYKTTGTIDSISSTTLTATSSIFNNGMVGDRVYNSTRENYKEIDSYTSGTVVVLDDAPDDWEATDTIYVLGTEFALGGDATDLEHITWVGVKYDTTDTYYTKCDYKPYNKIYEHGGETYAESDPKWCMTSKKVSSVLTTAIVIVPEAEENIANGIYMRYAELPSAMSSDTDTPRLPGNHAVLWMGGVADAYRKLREFDKAKEWESKYQLARQELVMNYPLTRGSGTQKTVPPRRARYLLDRLK